jgi:type IV fimbrial biogenesis protein FimT
MLKQRGFTLMEVIVGMAILAISLTLVVPNLSAWSVNSKIRTQADVLQNGLQYARAEAIRRNTTVRFQLTSTLDSSCTLTTSGPFWLINLGSANTPASSCGSTLSDTTSPYIVQRPPTSSISGQLSISATQSVVAFNSLGRMTATTNPSTSAGTVTYQITSSSVTCLAASGTARCLNVAVSPAGQIRLCDPSLTSSTSNNNPMAC